MNEADLIEARAIIELMRMENNQAEHETQHGDGWLSDHAGAIRGLEARLDSVWSRYYTPTTGKIDLPIRRTRRAEEGK